MAGDQKKFQTAMAKAEQLSQQKDWAEATKAYRFALAEFPNNEVAVLGFGRASLFGGQVDTAKQAFEHALRVNPANYQVLTYMADLHERMGQLDAAAESYLRAGNIASSQGNLDTAIDFWLRATKLVSDHVDAHRNLANTLVQQGEKLRAARQWLTLAAIYQRRDDRDMAMQQIQQAGKLLPDDIGVAAAVESLQNDTPIQPDRAGEAPPETASTKLPDLPFDDSFDGFGDDPFAIDEAEQVGTSTAGLIEGAQQTAATELANLIFEEEGNPNTMLIMQAIELQRQQNTGQAVENFRKALDSGINRPSLYFNLGLLYKEIGQHDEAVKMLQVSARDKQYALSSQFALAFTYHAANNVELAVRNFVEVVKTLDLQTVNGEQTGQVMRQYEGLADKYLAEGDVSKIDDFATSLKDFFSDPEWERNIYLARRRMENVNDDGAQAMTLAEYLETPQAAAIINALALTGEYLKRNQVMTASEECLFAIQKAPFYLPLHVRLGDILLRQEKTDQAIEKYLAVANVFEMRGQPDQVVNIYQKILRLAPMDVTVRSKLIDLYSSLNNIDHALDQYLILADSYYQLAQVDRALEKYSEAARLAATIENANTWRVQILRQMGDIYNQRFDWSKATAAYEELCNIDPENERAQRELIDLYYKQNKTDQAITRLDNLLAVYQRQSPAKSLEMLRELVPIYPNDMVIRQRLAVAYVQNGMNKEAIAEYDALGEIQLEQGFRDQAIQTIQAILDLRPEDPAGYERLLSKIKGGGI